MFCWGLCGYKVFLSGLRNCPCQGPCPNKVFRGFAFGADRTPHDSRHQPWWLGVEAVLVRRFGPVQIRKNPAAGRTFKPRGQATDMKVAFIARGIPAQHPCGGRGAVSRKYP